MSNWKPPVYGFGLLRAVASEDDPLITGGLDDEAVVIADVPEGVADDA